MVPSAIVITRITSTLSSIAGPPLSDNNWNFLELSAALLVICDQPVFLIILVYEATVVVVRVYVSKCKLMMS